MSVLYVSAGRSCTPTVSRTCSASGLNEYAIEACEFAECASAGVTAGKGPGFGGARLLRFAFAWNRPICQPEARPLIARVSSNVVSCATPLEVVPASVPIAMRVGPSTMSFSPESIGYEPESRLNGTASTPSVPRSRPSAVVLENGASNGWVAPLRNEPHERQVKLFAFEILSLPIEQLRIASC